MNVKSRSNVLFITTVLLVQAMVFSQNEALAKERAYYSAAKYVAEGFPMGVYSGPGKATYLGRTSESGSYTVVEFVAPGVALRVGEGIQVASNGDTLTYTFEEIIDFSGSQPVITAIGSFTITGGTGKFQGAIGSGMTTTTGDFLPDGSLGLSISYFGTIDY
jgi:hypothetical protein